MSNSWQLNGVLILKKTVNSETEVKWLLESVQFKKHPNVASTIHIGMPGFAHSLNFLQEIIFLLNWIFWERIIFPVYFCEEELIKMLAFLARWSSEVFAGFSGKSSLNTTVIGSNCSIFVRCKICSVSLYIKWHVIYVQSIHILPFTLNHLSGLLIMPIQCKCYYNGANAANSSLAF